MQSFLDIEIDLHLSPAHFLRLLLQPRIFRLPLCGISFVGALKSHGTLSAAPV
jgi:hypothetical protein